MSNIEQRLKTVEDNTSEILHILKSNPDFNKKGLVEEVGDLRKEVNTLVLKEKLFNTKLMTYISVFTFFAGAILWIGDKIFGLIFKN